MRLNSSWSRVVVGGWCVAAVGCMGLSGGPDGGGNADAGTATGRGGGGAGSAAGGGASGPVSLTTFCAAYQSATCDYLFRCGVVDDRDRCLASVSPTCPSEDCPAARTGRASVTAGRQAYDAQAAADCFESARNQRPCVGP